MLLLVLPLRVENLYRADTGGVEELCLAVGGVVAPNLNIVCREGNRLDESVALGAGV